MTAPGSKRWALAAFFLLTALTGCNAVAQYAGDGQLTDNGSNAATDRYVLNLGVVSLKRPMSLEFQMRKLPKVEFVLGIEVRSSSKIDPKLINPTIGISLLEDGQLVLTKEAKLSEWTWSIHSPGTYAFVYGREDPSTYFAPKPGKNYTLSFTVKDPDSTNASYSAALVAKSGGWK